MNSLKILKKLGKISIDTIVEMIKNGKEGVSIYELMKLGEKKLREKYDLSFPICISVNEIIAHHHPTKKGDTLLKKGDIVSIDLGAYDKNTGLMVDCARTFEVESKKKKSLIETSISCFDKAIEKIKELVLKKEKIKIKEISKEISKEAIKKNFFPIKGLSGHGISEEVLHAAPRIPNNWEESNDIDELSKKKIYAIEPLLFEREDKVIHWKTEEIKMIKINKIYEENLARNELLKKIFINFRFRWISFERVEELIEDSKIKIIEDLEELENSNLITIDRGYLKSLNNTISVHYENSIYIDENLKVIILTSEGS